MALRSETVPVAALRTAAVVGTLLTLANQGPALLSGNLTGPMLLQGLLNYLIPFAVSVHSRRQLLRELAGDITDRAAETNVIGT